jgi:hypothetical protein
MSLNEGKIRKEPMVTTAVMRVMYLVRAGFSFC